MRRTFIDGTQYEVLKPDEYDSKRKYVDDIAMQLPDDSVYPIVKDKASIGVHSFMPGTGRLVKPKDTTKYDTAEVIDFNNVSSISEFLSKNQELTSKEEELLLDSGGNIFTPKIHKDDDPIMKLYRLCFQAKAVNFNKYAKYRLGPNPGNIKRNLTKDTSISTGKLREISKAFDIKVTVRFEDANDHVPNPIGMVMETDIDELTPMFSEYEKQVKDKLKRIKESAEEDDK